MRELRECTATLYIQRIKHCLNGDDRSRVRDSCKLESCDSAHPSQPRLQCRFLLGLQHTGNEDFVHSLEVATTFSEQ